jgi:RHS repeat-associated protein
VNNFRFAGQYFDAETGLHYNYHRHYDPKTGRYLPPDPIGLLGGNNLFLYADGNPINYVDPYGLWWAWGLRILTFFARYLRYVPPATKVAQDYLDESPGVTSAVKELKRMYDNEKQRRITELERVIKLHDQFYRQKFDDCLRICRNSQISSGCPGEDNNCNHCMVQYSQDYEEMVSPYRRSLYDLRH